MSKMTPVEQSKYIENEYGEYLRSTFDFGDAKYAQMFSDELKKEVLYKGPYLSMTAPFKTASSIRELVDKGTVCKEFLKLGDIDFDLKLYDHQQRAIEKVANGRSLVVTTGTGSGKTESFLYPILNEIMKDIERGDNPAGVRAVLLYPMNALVNDQMERVRKILAAYPKITFGYFTGDTPETANSRERAESMAKYGYQIPENELISREEIRERPPHLLFTNYSMLEYLLIRPNDSVLFRANNLTHWKYIVLDEAHTYTGAKGIEVALLLRRLTGLAEKKPGFILTSATLGSKGESEEEIVRFAKDLTTAEYTTEDIIFANRKALDSSLIAYPVDPDDYVRLDQAADDLTVVRSICNEYIDVVHRTDTNGCLYDLLIHDENVHEVYRLLSRTSITFKALHNQMDYLNEEQLTSLIHLINIARDGFANLFDIKYHSFVRAVSGAYMTMGKDRIMSLKKTNWIGDSRAFEIGTCKYCNSMYILGKRVESREDGVTRLYQNDDIDIYENYGDEDEFELDYFLINNTMDEFDPDDVKTSEFTLCSKCGAVFNPKNLNAAKCDCGEEFETRIIYVNNPTTSSYRMQNNVLECPCCRHKSNNGVVRTPSLGKETATAILSQLLFRAIDDSDTKKTEESFELSFSDFADPAPEQKASVKQFLAFSDSRQQASFYATFFQSNHESFLNKRLLWELIQEKEYADIPVEYAVSLLTKMISERELFDDDMNAEKHAWVAVLSELMKVNGSFDGEGLGLFHFALDLQPVLQRLSDAAIESEFGKYDIDRQSLETLINVIFTPFKTQSAINHTQSTLNGQEREKYLEYRRFDNYMTLQLSSRSQNVMSFLPIKKGARNSAISYVKRVCNCDDDAARDIMTKLFNVIGYRGGLFHRHATEEAYQIEAGKYILKNYKNSKYFRCSRCGSVTPYNIHNVCVRPDCDGTLVEIDPDVELANNYYRKEYKNKIIERLKVCEHTAQLDRKAAKEYQNEFKNKQINVLSCSTTFEMGVDLGGLETVFLRNVPPTPANYVQRAGRAGRRKDSSAFVLTYCSASSHDYTYFDDPIQLIAGVIKPPYFSVTNEKIVVRHLLAAALGSFFRKYPAYFSSIESLIFEGGVDRFIEYVESKPKSLGEYIDHKILTDDIRSKYSDFKWFEYVKDSKMLSYYVGQIKESMEAYLKAKDNAAEQENFKDANYYASQIARLQKEKVIESLSRNSIIPRYGFPVDVVNLKVVENGHINNKYDLSRDLKMAISEYAPESEIMVDGDKLTSAYITVPRDSELKRYYYMKCNRCGRYTVSETYTGEGVCSYCKEPFDDVKSQYFVIPRLGFKTGPTKDTSRLKPKRSYVGEVAYVGGGEATTHELIIPGVLRMTSTTDDQLLVMNRKHFNYCPRCGYSEISKIVLAKTIKKPHKDWRGYECANTEMQLISLGHLFKTDAVRIEMPALRYGSFEDHSAALSFLYALLDGISIAYNIERTDIGGLLDLNARGNAYDIIIYDDVPGGAGYMKRLMDEDAIIAAIKAAKAKVSQNCCDEDTSCNHCLRNYYNQHYHPRLKRKYALRVIAQLTDSIKGAQA